MIIAYNVDTQTRTRATAQGRTVMGDYSNHYMTATRFVKDLRRAKQIRVKPRTVIRGMLILEDIDTGQCMVLRMSPKAQAALAAELESALS